MKKLLILNLTLAIISQAALAETTAPATARSSRKPVNPALKAGQTAATATGSSTKVQRNTEVNQAPMAATSIATTQTSWRQSISASLVSNIAGPSISNPGENQPDSATGKPDPSAPVRTENTLGLGLKLANGASIGAAMNFGYTTVANSGLEMQDPYLSIKKGLIDKNGFNLMGQIRAYAPVTTASQAANQIGRTRFVLVQNYTPNNSRWSVGVTAYAQAYLYNANRAENATKLKVLAEPSINYQIKPNLTAGLMYDMLAKNKYDNSFFKFFEADETALAPNISWDVNSRLNLSPYISIPTGKRIAADTSTINMLLSLRLL